jgi:antitoxin component of MazEF toxin-antitoxin module
MRKISAGTGRMKHALTFTLWAYRRQSGRPGVNTLRLQLPPSLMAILHWTPGQAIRVNAEGGRLKCSPVKISSAVRAIPAPRKTAAQRLQFERAWARTMDQLRRGPKSRRWRVEARKRLGQLGISRAFGG